MIVSSTEPLALREVAEAVSTFPETYGADILVADHTGNYAGVQRKEVRDLFASIDDGRLAEQCAKLRQLPSALLIIEGELHFGNDGHMVTRWGRMSRDRFDGLMWHVQADGVWLTFTADLAETVRVLQHYERWRGRPARALNTRGQVAAAWGTPDSRDYKIHLLCGFPGIGPEMAARIVDTVGLPWRSSVSREHLLAIDGLGPKRVDAMLALLKEDA